VARNSRSPMIAIAATARTTSFVSLLIRMAELLV